MTKASRAWGRRSRGGLARATDNEEETTGGPSRKADPSPTTESENRTARESRAEKHALTVTERTRTSSHGTARGRDHHRAEEGGPLGGTRGEANGAGRRPSRRRRRPHSGGGERSGIRDRGRNDRQGGGRNSRDRGRPQRPEDRAPRDSQRSAAFRGPMRHDIASGRRAGTLPHERRHGRNSAGESSSDRLRGETRRPAARFPHGERGRAGQTGTRRKLHLPERSARPAAAPTRNETGGTRRRNGTWGERPPREGEWRPRGERGRQRAAGPHPRAAREIVGETEGVLELSDRGFGFLRQSRRMYHPTPDDVFVPPAVVRDLKLREGLRLAGAVSPARNGGLELARVDTINGHPPDVYGHLKPLEDLIPTDPDQRLRFATGPEPATTRIVDLITPIGKGQRALIVAPPRTGKTVLLQHMAHGISENHPEVVLKVLLIDERPEEVTDMKRTVRGEVVASSSDMNSDAHVRVAELVLEQARREVEFGHDVVIFLDSLTRLGRAYNRETGNSGRTLTGGIDSRALERPKRIFGAARNIEHGGSLTIIATALIDTGSRMDEVIFQEFKGTGNMEMVLDRTIADMRIWPAVDVRVSGTRKEEKLYTSEELPRIRELRRMLSPLDPLAAIQELLRNLDLWEGNAVKMR